MQSDRNADLARLEQAEDSLLQIFLDEVDGRTGEFFCRVGLPRAPTWGSFRRRYDRGGTADIERATRDLAATPV